MIQTYKNTSISSQVFLFFHSLSQTASLEEARRDPADWKHLGDCRERSHILSCWQRFDGALWSDGFDLSRRTSVQLPGSCSGWRKGQSQGLRALDGAAAFDASSVDSQRLSSTKMQPARWCTWWREDTVRPISLFIYRLFLWTVGAFAACNCAVSRPCSALLLKISTTPNTIMPSSSFQTQNTEMQLLMSCPDVCGGGDKTVGTIPFRFYPPAV